MHFNISATIKLLISFSSLVSLYLSKSFLYNSISFFFKYLIIGLLNLSQINLSANLIIEAETKPQTPDKIINKAIEKILLLLKFLISYPSKR